MRKIFIVLLALCSWAIYAEKSLESLLWPGTELKKSVKSKLVHSVEGNSTIRTFLRYKVMKAEPGFRMEPFVIFEDVKGKIISTKSMGETLPDPKNTDFVDAEIYLKVPAKAVKGYFSYLLYGNLGQVEIVENILAKAAMPVREKMKYSKMPADKRLTDAQLDKILSSRSIAKAEIKRNGQYNTIAINGKEIVPSIYLTTGYKTPMRYSMTNAYNKAGVNIISCSMSLGIGRHNKNLIDIWQGENQYNIKAIQKELRNILKEAPNAYILLNLSVSHYRGYLQKYPDEAYKTSKGEFVGFFHGYARKAGKELFVGPKNKDGLSSEPSYYSEHFANSAAKAIFDICKAITQMPEGKAVIAIYLNGGTDGQWYDQFDSGIKNVGDGSLACKKAFAKYLKEKYSSVDNLRKAWQENDVTFDNFKVPSYEELWDKNKVFHTFNRASSRLSDYCEFLGVGLAQRHILWCKAVKAGSNNRFLAGSYFNNSGLRGYPQIGHQSVRCLLKAKEVDLLALVPSYQRNYRQPVHQGGFTGSLIRHGKMLITELDLRTGELPYWGRWGMPFWRSHNPAERFDVDASRYAISAIVKGGTFHIYDMEGGVFNSQNAKNSWSKAVNLLSHRTPRPLTSNHIGVISSEKYWNYKSFGKDRITVYTLRETPLHALYRAGVDHKNYLLEDVLEDDFIAPKVMIFLDSSTLTVDQAKLIRKKYGKDNRVICWLGTPGIFTDNGVEKISQITGFNLVRAVSADNKPLVATASKSSISKNLKGFLFPFTPEYFHEWSRAYKIVDKDAQIIAKYYKTNIPGGAVKEYKNHTEVYLGAIGALTPQLCRNFANKGNVHVFLDSDDFAGMNAGLLYVSSLSSGKKVITLPKDVKNVKCLTFQKIEQSNGRVSCIMKTGELLILKLFYK